MTPGEKILLAIRTDLRTDHWKEDGRTKKLTRCSPRGPRGAFLWARYRHDPSGVVFVIAGIHSNMPGMGLLPKLYRTVKKYAPPEVTHLEFEVPHEQLSARLAKDGFTGRPHQRMIKPIADLTWQIPRAPRKKPTIDPSKKSGTLTRHYVDAIDTRKPACGQNGLGKKAADTTWKREAHTNKSAAVTCKKCLRILSRGRMEQPSCS